MKKIILALMAVAVSTISYGQTTFLVENFEYPANDSLQNHGWTAHSAGSNNPIQITSPGLFWTMTPYQGSGIGNAAAVNNTGSDENRPLVPADVDTGSIYVSFLAKVGTEVTTSNAGVFFHIGRYSNMTNPDFSSISNAFRARVHKRPGSSADKFHFGLTFNAGTAGVNDITTAEYDTGTTYLLVVKYDFIPGANNDSVSLYVFEDGDNIQFEPSSPTIGPFGGTQADMPVAQLVALRQYDTGQDITVDGIIVRDHWNLLSEPVVPEPVSPPNNTNLFVNGPASSQATVSWTAAQNFPDTVTYEWQFDLTAPGSFSPPLLSLPSDNGGIDTTITLSFGAVDSILNALGVNVGDTVPGVWRVMASNGSDTLVSDTVFNINIIRGVISAPFTPFSLLSPADNTLITVGPTSTQDANIVWQPTKAGTTPVTYTWHAVLSGGNFSSPLVSLSSDNQGSDTTLTLAFSEIDSLLATLGVSQGDTTLLDWTIEAIADTFSSFAEEAWSIEIVRETSVSVKLFNPYDDVKLYPNPAMDIISISNLPDYFGDVFVNVIDQSGRVVYSENISTRGITMYDVDVSKLKSGAYILNISNNDHQSAFRFLKQ